MEEINNNNKRKFITETKDIAATNPYCNWDNASWGRGVTFYRYSKQNSKKKDKEVLPYDFCELVKSYIFRFHLTNPNKAQEVIKAFRLIEIALLKSVGVADITKLTHVILDEAILEAYLRFIPDTVKKIYKDMRNINDFLCKKGIINSHVSTWYFKFDKGNDNETKVIESGDNDKNQKLPDLRVIEFMGKVFRSKHKSPRDIFTTSIFALLLCTPSRISEVMNLNEDCLIKVKDSNGEDKHGLRFFAVKGFGYSIKWVPDCMVSVAKEAISRLRILGTNAKATSDIISNGEAYLYKALDKKPFDIMTVSDLKKLGFDYSLSSLSKECSAFIKKMSKSEVSVKSFWNYLIKKDLNKINRGKENSFYTKGKLVVISHNQLNVIKGNDIFICVKGTKNFMKSEFLSNVKERLGYLNIFERHKRKNINNDLLKFNSHQSRHLLNTLAQRTALSEIEIAFWSGRKNIEHNSNYNHVTDDEMIAMSRKLLLSEKNDSTIVPDTPTSPIISKQFVEQSMKALREKVKDLDGQAKLDMIESLIAFRNNLEDKLNEGLLE